MPGYKNFGDKRPYRKDGDRPFRREGERSFDRPRRDGDNSYRKDGDRPFHREGERSFDRPRRDGDRPYRKDGDRPFHREGERSFDRPRRDGDRPYRKDGDRPFRREGERSFDRPRRDGDRPYRKDGDRPFRREGERRFDSSPVYRQKRLERDLAEQPESTQNPALPLDAGTVPLAADASQVRPPEPIEIPAWFKKLLVLTTDKGREREGRFLAEGVRCVEEMIAHHTEMVDGIYWKQGVEVQELLDKAIAAELRTHDLEPELFDQLSSTVTSQGILAVCRSASAKPDYGTARTLTLVDAIQDPGNLGTLFRTSLAFGMDGILLGKGTTDPFNPKVVRGSSGTFLREPFETGVDLAERIDFLHRKGFTVVATSSHAKGTISQIPAHRLRKVALLVGNEGAGADDRLLTLADEVVKIPMQGDVESLNVAVAHGILAFQVLNLLGGQ